MRKFDKIYEDIKYKDVMLEDILDEGIIDKILKRGRSELVEIFKMYVNIKLPQGSGSDMQNILKEVQTVLKAYSERLELLTDFLDSRTRVKISKNDIFDSLDILVNGSANEIPQQKNEYSKAQMYIASKMDNIIFGSEQVFK